MYIHVYTCILCIHMYIHLSIYIYIYLLTYVYIYMYKHIYIHIFINLCLYIRMSIYICIYTEIHTYRYIYGYIYIYIYIYIYVCTYIHIYLHIYTLIHIHTVPNFIIHISRTLSFNIKYPDQTQLAKKTDMLEQVTEALEQALRDKRLAEEATEFCRRTSDVRHMCDTLQHSATHWGNDSCERHITRGNNSSRMRRVTRRHESCVRHVTRE